MKKAILPVIVLSALVGVGTAVWMLLPKPAEEKSIFDLSVVEELEENKIAYSISANGIYEISQQKEFTHEGCFEIKADKGGKFQKIAFRIPLFGKTEEENGYLKVTDPVTAEMYGSVIAEVTQLNKQVAQTIACPVAETPVCVNYTSEEHMQNRPEDNMEAMLGGYVMLEYSYRNSEDCLWLLHVFSPYEGVIEATVSKIIDESGYDNFEPIVNMAIGSENQERGE